jgi:hypothetical protein
MAKKTAPFDPTAAALEALAPSLADPGPRVLFGTAKVPGFFQGSAAKTRQVAEVCLKEKWLEETGNKVGTGIRAKTLYRMTPQGVQTVLQHSPALMVLQGLKAGLSCQQEQLQSLTLALHEVQAAVQQLSAQDTGRRLEELIRTAVEKLNPPDVREMLSGLAASRSEPIGRPQETGQPWQDEIVRRAAQTDPSHPLPLPELFRDLKQTWKGLELGQFHDGLRALRDAGRICLRPYTRAYAEIAGHREALFLDGEVMYYVRGD